MPQTSSSRAPQQQKQQQTIPGELRVVVIGDSLAYGAGDESRQGIPGRLKDELRTRGVDAVETINLGVNGAQTADLIDRLKQARIRNEIKNADAIVLSIGANDLFRTPSGREETLRNPLVVATRILERIGSIVATFHELNPEARILILGGYNPVPTHPQAKMINQYLGLWDGVLSDRFAEDPRIEIVRMDDVVTRDRLSRYDNFHPGSEAYIAASKRIATMLLET
ncbi:MAG TPA: GDSL-type esterase/lipase family protein [Thermoanaerobaculia bacterium]